MSAVARYIVDGIVLEHRSPTELARQTGKSRSWIYAQLARYKAGGYTALEPRSRRPHSCPRRADPEVEAKVVELRHELVAVPLAHRQRMLFAPAVRRFCA